MMSEKNIHKRWYKNRSVSVGLMAVYSFFLLYLLFVRGRVSMTADPAAWRREHSNFILLSGVSEYIGYIISGNDPAAVRQGIVNLAGNTLLFVPFGFMIPYLFTGMRSLRKVMLLMASAVTAVELMQMLTLRGSCDVDDLLLNLIGTAAGYMLFTGCKLFTAQDLKIYDTKKEPGDQLQES